MSDLVCTGEVLIDFLADRPGISLTEARLFTWAAGGAPANVAVAAARLGIDTAFMGKVGKDPFGVHIRETLAASGVDVSRLLATSKARTSLAFVALPTPDDPQFMFFRHPSADMLYRPDELDEAFLRSCQCFHFGSMAAEMVRSGGGFVSFDANYRPALWPPAAARERIFATLPLCDVLKVNEGEVRLLAGKSDLVAGAKDLLGLGPKVCLVTHHGPLGGRHGLWRRVHGCRPQGDHGPGRSIASGTAGPRGDPALRECRWRTDSHEEGRDTLSADGSTSGRVPGGVRLGA